MIKYVILLSQSQVLLIPISILKHLKAHTFPICQYIFAFFSCSVLIMSKLETEMLFKNFLLVQVVSIHNVKV